MEEMDITNVLGLILELLDLVDILDTTKNAFMSGSDILVLNSSLVASLSVSVLPRIVFIHSPLDKGMVICTDIF